MRCDCQLRFYLFAAVLLFASVASAIDAANETQREEEMVVSEEPVLAVDDDPGQPDEAESVLVSLLTIALSGIGDKTFLLAAILSMKHSRAVVFTGAFSSLALMAILSCWLGNLVPRNYTDLFAAILFFTSGLRMLWECWRQYRERKQQDMSSGCTDEEKQRVSATAAAAEDVQQQQQACTVTQENDLQIFLQTFALTFLGEWGDKSQISTIALAASNVTITIQRIIQDTSYGVLGLL